MPLLIRTGTDMLLAFVRILCFIVALYAFIFTWGAFDAALVFYPDDRTDDSLRHQPHSMRPDEPISIDPDNQTQNSAWEKAQKP